MSQILCSTGAMIGRPNGRNYRLLPDLVHRLSCDGFEFMMYDAWYDETDEVTETVLALNLPIPVMHCEKSVGEAISRGEAEEAYRLFEINCNIANRLSVKDMVIHLWGGLPSDQHFQNNIEAYPHLEETARLHGIRPLIENVVCNKDDPMRHLCELTERYPDICFVFDTKMAAFHGQLDLLYQPEYQWLWQDGHICHYHVNDYGGGIKDWSNLRTMPIGEGCIDFDRFFTYIRGIGYDGTFTVEATAFGTDGKVDTDMLNDQFEAIRKGLAAHRGHE